MVYCLTIPQGYAQQASVRSELSASTITRDETVVLTVSAVGIDAELDATSLENDFDVIGRSSSREVRTVSTGNNQLSTVSIVTWALELMPKNVGVFTVPAVKVGDLSTQLLTLTVNDVPKGAKRDIFVEATVDTSEPWVQSQVIITISVFRGVDIVDGGLDVPSGIDLVVERIGEDTHSRQVRDGREYSVTERRFALFAQKSGPTVIEPVTLSVTVPADPTRVRGFFSPTRKLTRRTLPITLNVQPRVNGGNGWWLPAKSVQLEGKWATPLSEAKVDQPLTRTIVFSAEGALESQLPEISVPAIDGVSLYAEDPERAMRPTENGLVAEQQINWALIPQRSGTITLPEINVEWFNTQTGLKEVATLPQERIQVQAVAQSIESGATTGSDDTGDQVALTTADEGINAGADVQPDEISTEPAELADSTVSALSADGQDDSLALPDSERSDSSDETGTTAANSLTQRVTGLESSLSYWRLFAAIAVLLWLSTLIAWFWKTRRDKSEGTDSFFSNQQSANNNRKHGANRRAASFSGIESVCKHGDIRQVKSALLDWARQRWPENPPTTLSGLASLLPEGPARRTILQIDRALYGKSSVTESDLKMAVTSLSGDLKDAARELQGQNKNGHAHSKDKHNNGLPAL